MTALKSVGMRIVTIWQMLVTIILIWIGAFLSLLGLTIIGIAAIIDGRSDDAEAIKEAIKELFKDLST